MNWPSQVRPTTTTSSATNAKELKSSTTTSWKKSITLRRSADFPISPIHLSFSELVLVVSDLILQFFRQSNKILSSCRVMGPIETVSDGDGIRIIKDIQD